MSNLTETWNNLKEWVHPLPDDHDPSDRKMATILALDDEFAMGIIYRREPPD